MKNVKVIMFPEDGTGRVEFTFKCLEEAVDFLDTALNHIEIGHITVTVQKTRLEVTE